MLLLAAQSSAWQLSRAKHRSMAGHSRIARRIAALIPHYEYDEAEVLPRR
jgi:glutamate-1-semialdehyde 2,1-aminomutase